MIPEMRGPIQIMDVPIRCVVAGAFLNLFKVIAKKPKQTNLKKPKRAILSLLTRSAFCSGFKTNKNQNKRVRKTMSKKLNRKI
jgi:hypothetical protein